MWQTTRHYFSSFQFFFVGSEVLHLGSVFPDNPGQLVKTSGPVKRHRLEVGRKLTGQKLAFINIRRV